MNLHQNNSFYSVLHVQPVQVGKSRAKIVRVGGGGRGVVGKSPDIFSPSQSQVNLNKLVESIMHNLIRCMSVFLPSDSV